jgi:hypothetical protein
LFWQFVGKPSSSRSQAEDSNDRIKRCRSLPAGHTSRHPEPAKGISHVVGAGINRGRKAPLIRHLPNPRPKALQRDGRRVQSLTQTHKFAHGEDPPKGEWRQREDVCPVGCLGGENQIDSSDLLEGQSSGYMSVRVAAKLTKHPCRVRLHRPAGQGTHPSTRTDNRVGRNQPAPQ